MERQDGSNGGLEISVEGRRMVRKLNIDGDAQGDLAGHGGEQRAVFVYQMDSYHYWERFLGRANTKITKIATSGNCRIESNPSRVLLNLGKPGDFGNSGNS